MKKPLLLILIALSSIGADAQYILKGNVLDENQKGIPGVRVSLENSTYGVPTNSKGSYFLEVEEQGWLNISFSMLCS